MSPVVRKFVQPLLGRLLEWECRRLQKKFLSALDNFQNVQCDLLISQLQRHAASDFGRRYDFASIRTVADFRRAMPLTTYADVEPYIEQVRDGRCEAMFGRGTRVHMFAMTSGTTSRAKYIPVTDDYLRQYRTGWMTWGLKTFLDHPAAFQSYMLQLVSSMNDEQTPCGLPAGAISGLTAATQKRAARNIYSSPPCVAEIKHTPTKYYVALLMALRFESLTIVSANPSTLLGLARTLDEQHEMLLDDLARGRVNDSIDLPPTVREQLTHALKPHERRARQLRDVARRGGGLRPRDAWHMPFIGCWKGGTLSLYLRQFPQWYGGTAVRDIGLIASEGRMTIPLHDEGAAGVLDVQGSFFEFLPASDGRNDGSETLLPHEVEVGREYYIILTTPSGLYRYNIGDLVRIEGFVGGSPLVTFLSKGAHASNLTGEKLTEHQVVAAVNDAVADLNLNLLSYCLAPTWDDNQPYYSLLVESCDVGGNAATAQKLAANVDHRLRELNIEYQGKRDSKRLGVVRVRLLAPGAWQKYDAEVIAARRRGIEQYKHQFLATDPQFERRFAAIEERATSG